MSLMEKERPPGRTRRRFTKEFKADAVALVLDGGPAGGPCGPMIWVSGRRSVGNWVRQARIDRGDKPGLTTVERSELVRFAPGQLEAALERELPCERRPCGCRGSGQRPAIGGSLAARPRGSRPQPRAGSPV